MVKNQSKKTGDCSYHLCDKKQVDVYRCKYCNEYFCKEHLKAKEPMAAPFKSTDIERQIKWKDKTGHPCIPYLEYVIQKERQLKYKNALNSMQTVKHFSKKTRHKSIEPEIWRKDKPIPELGSLPELEISDLKDKPIDEIELENIKQEESKNKTEEKISDETNFVTCDKCGKKIPEKEARKIYSSVLDRNVIYCSSCYSFSDKNLNESKHGKDINKIEKSVAESPKEQNHTKDPSQKEELKPSKINKNKIFAVVSIIVVLTLVVCGLQMGFIASLFSTEKVEITTCNVELNSIDDTIIVQENPSNSYGDRGYMNVRNVGSSGLQIDSLVKFDLSPVSSDVTVISATLNLYYYNWDANYPAGRNLNIYRITSRWGEDTVTWNTQPSYASQRTSNATVPSSYSWMAWNVTSDVQSFVAGELDNYGWKITDENYWSYKNIPQIYLLPKGYDDYTPYLAIEYSDALNSDEWLSAIALIIVVGLGVAVSAYYLKNSPYKRKKLENRREKTRARKQYSIWQTIRYKYKRTRMPVWFIGCFVAMVLVALLHQYYVIKIALFDLPVIFYILEIIVVGYAIFWLLKKFDRISVHNNMRLFGLRILSGLLGFIGLILVYFVFIGPIFAFFDKDVASILYFGKDFGLLLTGQILFIVVGFGLMFIGGYLLFKFKRNTGQFVWFE